MSEFILGFVVGSVITYLALSRIMDGYVAKCYLKTRLGSATDFWHALHQYTKKEAPK